MDDIADLEIGLYHWDADHYAIDLRFDAPGQPVTTRPYQSNPVQFDRARLRELALDPRGYGELLWQSLFADDNVREFFARCTACAEGYRNAQGEPQPLPLRLRLYISPGAPEMHALLWETLRQPLPANWLVTSERTFFCRYLISSEARPIRPVPDTPAALKALVMIADPSDLAGYRPGGRILPPVDVKGEGERAHASLAGLDVSELSRLAAVAGQPPRRATLDNLTAALRDGCDFLYLVCHGALVGGEPVLWLENATGTVDTVAAAELVERLRELKSLPRLVVLASCQSAGTGADARSDDGGALAALGPRLAEAGIPAVLAMQGNVSMATVEAFMPVLFRELVRNNGQIDRALAVARGAVRDRPDWWMPVLFLRLKTGRLWGGPATDGDDRKFTQWPVLLQRLQEGNCTPVLGSGMTEALIGTTREIARRWAETYRFPLAPHDRDDLPQVAQYLEVVLDRSFPRGELNFYLRRQLRRRFADDLAALPSDASLDDLLLRAAEALRQRTPLEPHALLAALPFPVYVTTNGDSLLAEALTKVTAGGQPKRPTVRVFSADSDAEGPLPAPPSVAAPLVYHLFGHLRDTDSLVLTEDDYFDFLINAAGKRRQIPPEVRRRLTKSSLLFLGFRLEEWDFRVLVRTINALEGSDLLQNYSQVAVQLDPEDGKFLEPDSARRYLEKHTRFAGKSISIYWGKVEQFLDELGREWATWQKQNA